jgi:hypothetical protein
VTKALGVESHVSIIERIIDLDDPTHFDSYPFAGQPIDLLFSDFRHGGMDTLQVLCHFLPRMASSSSIFVDSVPSSLCAFSVIERAVAVLNSGRASEPFRSCWTSEQAAAVLSRELRIMHLVEANGHAQNGCTWVKIEPLDIRAPGPPPAWAFAP